MRSPLSLSAAALSLLLPFLAGPVAAGDEAGGAPSPPSMRVFDPEAMDRSADPCWELVTTQKPHPCGNFPG